ncbi:hypothetical protein BGW39_006553 [Mortierella sp. 14UC]|nr:hypothetical protein BGW39_006553 [Mortierella sp. 14UC]
MASNIIIPPASQAAATTITTPQATATTPTPNKREKKDKPDQKYAPTLLLPKTDFPLRADAAVREHRFRQRATTDLYTWQRENNGGELFVLHDGPPYANGHLHLGHALNKLLKDFVNRHKVMQGFKVDYRPGWDCHGLPIELKALAELKVTDRSNLSPTQVRAVAQATAQSAVDSQREEFSSYAVMGDWANGYKTMDKDFETRQLRVFYEMMNKGLIYRANKPVYWSPSSKTALAESELEYREDHRSRSAWVAFAVDQPLWTTTPWTLPANRCVAVHPKMNYTLFKSSTASDPNIVYLTATDRMDEMKVRFTPPKAKPTSATDAAPATVEVVFETLAQLSGQDLVGSRYQHPLTNEKSLPFIAADYVTSDSGSGLVHTAPGHGMDDFKACFPLGIEAFCPVDGNGVFTAEAGTELEGLSVQTDGTVKVLEMLVTRGSLIQEQVYVHKYPYDWRTKKPVILRATSQWFANVGTIKEAALKAIESVRIVPEGARRRLEGFVLSRSEWCISRQRSWGVPIPVMYNVETDEPLLTSSSVQHVIDLVKEHGTDVWWTLSTEELLAPEYRNDGNTYRKGTDTMDVWFDSGTSWTMIEDKMPRPDLPFVADVYCEGSDQHRGWFQSSLLTSVALTGKAPFGTLITHGFLLDAKGFKQSKSLGNTVDPAVVINGGKNLVKEPAYGTDVLRLWAASSEYTKDIAIGSTILQQVAEGMLYGQLQYFSSTTLSSFYLDVIKDTLYSDAESSPTRRGIQTVLFHVLTVFNKAIAPLAPHFAEEVYDHYRDCFSPEHQQPTVFRTGWLDLVVREEWNNLEVREEFLVVKQLRSEVNQLLEQARAAKVIGPSLEAAVEVQVLSESSEEKEKGGWSKVVETYTEDFSKLFITSEVKVTHHDRSQETESNAAQDKDKEAGVFVRTLTSLSEESDSKSTKCRLVVKRASLFKCPRCWTFTAQASDALCGRCGPVVASLKL